MTMRRSWILVWRFNRWIPSSITSTLVEFRKMLAILRMRSYSRPGDAKDDPLSLSMRFSWSWRSLGSSCLSIVHIEVSPSTIARLSWDISDRRHFPGPEESSHLPLIRRSFSRLWGHQARAVSCYGRRSPLDNLSFVSAQATFIGTDSRLSVPWMIHKKRLIRRSPHDPWIGFPSTGGRVGKQCRPSDRSYPAVPSR